jgi:hypothetical protein
MTDYSTPTNWNNDNPLERANLQKFSNSIVHLKEVISGTNVVKIVTDALADLCITAAKLAADAVTTTKILNGAVTLAKLDQTVGTTGQVIIKALVDGQSAWTVGVPSLAINDLTDVTVLSPAAGEALVLSHGTQLSAPDSAVSVADGGAGDLTGTFTYKVTFFDDYGETTGGPASSPITVSGGQVSISSVPTGVGVTGRNVYRSDGGSYGLIASINDNTTTAFTDNDTNPTTLIPATNDTGELLWRNSPFALAPGNPGDIVTTTTDGVITWTPQDQTWNVNFPDVQAGDAIDVKYDDNFAIQQWASKAKEGETGSIEFDILKSEAPDAGGSWYNTFTSIVADAPPSIPTGDYAEDADLTGWDTDLEAGRWLRFEVTAVTGIANCTLALKVRRVD